MPAATFNGLTMVAGANTATTVKGSGGIDVLFGDNTLARATSVIAGAGADTMTTYGGNDTISGGTGNDTIAGGAGTDSINGDEDDDFVNVLTDDQ